MSGVVFKTTRHAALQWFFVGYWVACGAVFGGCTTVLLAGVIVKGLKGLFA